MHLDTDTKLEIFVDGDSIAVSYTHLIRESEGILLAIPFQLIGTGVCGAAEKAGQHGVAFYRAFNRGIDVYKRQNWTCTLRFLIPLNPPFCLSG